MLARNYKYAIKELLEDSLENLTDDELEEILNEEGYIRDNKPTVDGILLLNDLQEDFYDTEC
jgi:hypothetical protein